MKKFYRYLFLIVIFLGLFFGISKNRSVYAGESSIPTVDWTSSTATVKDLTYTNSYGIKFIFNVKKTGVNPELSDIRVYFTSDFSWSSYLSKSVYLYDMNLIKYKWKHNVTSGTSTNVVTEDKSYKVNLWDKEIKYYASGMFNISNCYYKEQNSYVVYKFSCSDVNSNSVTLLGVGDTATPTIPSKLKLVYSGSSKELLVKSVGNGVSAIDTVDNIVSMVLPSSLETISNKAFYNKSTITFIRFGSVKSANNLVSVGDKAFYGCSGFRDINFQSSDADTRGFNWQSLLKCKSLSVGDKAFYFNGEHESNGNDEPKVSIEQKLIEPSDYYPSGKKVEVQSIVSIDSYQTASPSDFLFVLDVSGSMKDRINVLYDEDYMTNYTNNNGKITWTSKQSGITYDNIQADVCRYMTERAIDKIWTLNPKNRVCVVNFADTAYWYNSNGDKQSLDNDSWNDNGNMFVSKGSDGLKQTVIKNNLDIVKTITGTDFIGLSKGAVHAAQSRVKDGTAKNPIYLVIASDWEFSNYAVYKTDQNGNVTTVVDYYDLKKQKRHLKSLHNIYCGIFKEVYSVGLGVKADRQDLMSTVATEYAGEVLTQNFEKDNFFDNLYKFLQSVVNISLTPIFNGNVSSTAENDDDGFTYKAQSNADLGDYVHPEVGQAGFWYNTGEDNDTSIKGNYGDGTLDLMSAPPAPVDGKIYFSYYMDYNVHEYGTSMPSVDSENRAEHKVTSGASFKYKGVYGNYQSTQKTVSTSDSLYGKWKVGTLTLDPNGGTFNNSTSNTSYYADVTFEKEIGTPTRNGYNFVKWQYVSGGSGLSDGANGKGIKYKFQEGEITYKAIWEPKPYKFVLTSRLDDTNNNDLKGLGTADVYPSGYSTLMGVNSVNKKYNCGTSVTVRNIKSLKDRVDFVGVYNTSGRMNPKDNDDGSVTGTIAYYSNENLGYDKVDDINNIRLWYRTWIKINVDPNGGSYRNSTSVYEYSKTYAKNKQAIEACTRDGYRFVGYTVSGNNGSIEGSWSKGKNYESGDIWASKEYEWMAGNADVTLTAQWMPLHTLTVDPNGGLYSGEDTGVFTRKMVYGEEYDVGVVDKPYSIFKEWKVESTGSSYKYTQINNNVDISAKFIMGNEDVKITAVYDTESKNLTVDPNTGKWTDTTGKNFIEDDGVTGGDNFTHSKESSQEIPVGDKVKIQDASKEDLLEEGKTVDLGKGGVVPKVKYRYRFLGWEETGNYTLGDSFYIKWRVNENKYSWLRFYSVDVNYNYASNKNGMLLSLDTSYDKGYSSNLSYGGIYRRDVNRYYRNTLRSVNSSEVVSRVKEFVSPSMELLSNYNAKDSSKLLSSEYKGYWVSDTDSEVTVDKKYDLENLSDLGSSNIVCAKCHKSDNLTLHIGSSLVDTYFTCTCDPRVKTYLLNGYTDDYPNCIHGWSGCIHSVKYWKCVNYNNSDHYENHITRNRKKGVLCSIRTCRNYNRWNNTYYCTKCEKEVSIVADSHIHERCSHSSGFVCTSHKTVNLIGTPNPDYLDEVYTCSTCGRSKKLNGTCNDCGETVNFCYHKLSSIKCSDCNASLRLDKNSTKKGKCYICKGSNWKCSDCNVNISSDRIMELAESSGTSSVVRMSYSVLNTMTSALADNIKYEVECPYCNDKHSLSECTEFIVSGYKVLQCPVKGNSILNGYFLYGKRGTIIRIYKITGKYDDLNGRVNYKSEHDINPIRNNNLYCNKCGREYYLKVDTTLGTLYYSYCIKCNKYSDEFEYYMCNNCGKFITSYTLEDGDSVSLDRPITNKDIGLFKSEDNLHCLGYSCSLYEVSKISLSNTVHKNYKDGKLDFVLNKIICSVCRSSRLANEIYCTTCLSRPQSHNNEMSQLIDLLKKDYFIPSSIIGGYTSCKSCDNMIFTCYNPIHSNKTEFLVSKNSSFKCPDCDSSTYVVCTSCDKMYSDILITFCTSYEKYHRYECSVHGRGRLSEDGMYCEECGHAENLVCSVHKSDKVYSNYTEIKYKEDCKDHYICPSNIPHAYVICPKCDSNTDVEFVSMKDSTLKFECSKCGETFYINSSGQVLSGTATLYVCKNCRHNKFFCEQCKEVWYSDYNKMGVDGSEHDCRLYSRCANCNISSVPSNIGSVNYLSEYYCLEHKGLIRCNECKSPVSPFYGCEKHGDKYLVCKYDNEECNIKQMSTAFEYTICDRCGRFDNFECGKCHEGADSVLGCRKHGKAQIRCMTCGDYCLSTSKNEVAKYFSCSMCRGTVLRCEECNYIGHGKICPTHGNSFMKCINNCSNSVLKDNVYTLPSSYIEYIMSKDVENAYLNYNSANYEEKMMYYCVSCGNAEMLRCMNHDASTGFDIFNGCPYHGKEWIRCTNPDCHSSMNISSVNVNLLHWQLPKTSVHYKHKYKFTDDNGWYCSTCNSAIRDNFKLIKAVKINKQYYIDNRLELDYEYYTSDIAHRYKPLIVADLNEYNSNGDIVPKYWNYNANYEERVPDDKFVMNEYSTRLTAQYKEVPVHYVRVQAGATDATTFGSITYGTETLDKTNRYFGFQIAEDEQSFAVRRKGSDDYYLLDHWLVETESGERTKISISSTSEGTVDNANFKWKDGVLSDIKCDLTITAVWKVDYSVIYNVQKGQSGELSSDLPDSYIIREKIDDVTQLPKTNLDGSSHTNNGYAYKQFRGFEYYVTNPKSKLRRVVNGRDSKTVVDLYYYRKVFQFDFYQNKPSVASGAVSGTKAYTNNVRQVKVAYGSNLTWLDTLSLEGWDFRGWYLDMQEAEKLTAKNSGVALARTAGIYNDTGNFVNEVAITNKSGSSHNNITKFTGGYIDLDGTQAIGSIDAKGHVSGTLYSGVDLYARWNPHIYTVKYIAPDATTYKADPDNAANSISNLWSSSKTDLVVEYTYDLGWKYFTKEDGSLDSAHINKYKNDSNNISYSKNYPVIYTNIYHYELDDTGKAVLQSTQNDGIRITKWDRRFEISFQNSPQHCNGHPNQEFVIANDKEIDIWNFIGWNYRVIGGSSTKVLSNLNNGRVNISNADKDLTTLGKSANIFAEGYNCASNTNASNRNLFSENGAQLEMTGVWKDLGIKYPSVRAESHRFVGWYTNQQIAKEVDANSGVAGNDAHKFNPRGVYYGGGEGIWNYDTNSTHLRHNVNGVVKRVIDSDMTLYSWWNSYISYVDVYDGIFYEGQDVSYNDLMRLIAIKDWEDDYKSSLVEKYDRLESETKSMLYAVKDEITDWEEQKAAYDEAVEDARNKFDELKEVDKEKDKVDDIDEKDVNKDSHASYDDILSQILLERNLEEPDVSVYNLLREKRSALEDVITGIEAELAKLSTTNTYIQGMNLVVQIKELIYENGASGVVSNKDLSGLNFKPLNEVLGVNLNDTASKEKFNSLTLSKREEAYRKLYLDTSTSRLDKSKIDTEFNTWSGKFSVHYTVTDFGVMSESAFNDSDLVLLNEAGVETEQLKVIAHEAVTVDYTKDCKILYNDVPAVYTHNLMFLNNDSVIGNRDALYSYIMDRQIALDLQDIQSNGIWWDSKLSSDNIVEHMHFVGGKKLNTLYEYYDSNLRNSVPIKASLWWNAITSSSPQEKYTEIKNADGTYNAYPNMDTMHHLQDRIVMTSCRVTSVDPAFEVSHPDKADELMKLDTFDKIFGFNGYTRSPYFKYITGVDMVIDTFDQFGKYASGKVTSYGEAKGVDEIQPTPPTPPTPPTDPDNPDKPDPDPDNPDPDNPDKPDPGDSDDPKPTPSEDRTVHITLVDPVNDAAMLNNKAMSNVRFIDEVWLDTLDNVKNGDLSGLVKYQSFFQTKGYGKEVLNKAFEIAKSKSDRAVVVYSSSYTNSSGKKVGVTVKDYTED